MQVFSSNIDLHEIRIKKPFVLNGSTIYTVFFGKEQNFPLLIQTPVASMEYSYSILFNRFFQIDLQINDNQAFIQFFTDVTCSIITRISQSCEKHKNIACYESPLKLRLKNYNVDNLRIFNAVKT